MWKQALRSGTGLLFLGAALAKLTDLQTQTISSSWLCSLESSAILILGELLVGLWLISNIAVCTCSIVCLVVLVCFLVVNTVGLVEKQELGGCLGVVNASPIFAIFLDLVLIAVLWFAKPPLIRSELRREIRASGKEILIVGAGASFCLFTLGWLAIHQYGSLRLAIAPLTSHGLIVIGSHQEEATENGLRSVHVRVKLRNLDSAPVSIVNVSSDCSCLSTSTLPVYFLPGAMEEICFIVKMKEGVVARMTRMVTVLTDGKNKNVMKLRLEI